MGPCRQLQLLQGVGFPMHKFTISFAPSLLRRILGGDLSGRGETRDHLYFECPFADAILRRILKEVKLDWRKDSLAQWGAVQKWMLQVARGKSVMAEKRKRTLAVIVYEIWRERNLRIFQ
ncbi:hypothetical protein Dimus_004916 [Dionaea muscipula]